MGNAVKNLSIVLGLIVIAFAGYYMYTQKDATRLDLGTSSVIDKETMLRDTQAFAAYSNTLNSQVTLNM